MQDLNTDNGRRKESLKLLHAQQETYTISIVNITKDPQTAVSWSLRLCSVRYQIILITNTFLKTEI